MSASYPKFAVIGALGQVGQEFTKHLRSERLVRLDLPDLDVACLESVRNCLAGLEFDIAINLAAFHQTDACEDQPEHAFAVNAVGAGNVARVCCELGRGVCFFSSDYVFGCDEQRSDPYFEGDQPGPVNAYGASKLAGEHLTRILNPRATIVRTSSLFGTQTSHKGSTFPEKMIEKARSVDKLKVVSDQRMSPTYTYDLAARTLAVLENGGTGVFHLSGGGECSWWEFAVEAIRMSGHSADIEPVSSEAFPTPARRPAYSRLDSRRLAKLGVPEMPHWKDGLRRYLGEKGLLEIDR